VRHAAVDVSVHFRFGLTNLGNATADSIFVQVQSDLTGKWSVVEYGWKMQSAIDMQYAASCEKLLHPRMTTQCAVFLATLPAVMVRSSAVPMGHVRFDFRIFAKDCEPVELSAKLTAEDLVDKKSQVFSRLPPGTIVACLPGDKVD
jgi:hypothetical protein